MSPIRAPSASVVHAFPSRRSQRCAELPGSLSMGRRSGIKILEVARAIDPILVNWKWPWQAG